MKRLREHPKGSGQYEYHFYDKKKSPVRKYIRFEADDYEDAELHVMQLRLNVKNGSYDPWLDITDNLEEAVIKYIEACSELRQSTVRMKKCQLGMFLKSTHHRSFERISKEDIACFVTSSAKPSTRAYKLSAISSFWQWCINKGYTQRNPVDQFRKSTKVKISMNYSERQPCTMDQYILLQGAGRQKNEYMEPFMELSICTGLRISEVMSLKIRDIKLDGLKGSINIRNWIHPVTKEEFTPKTHKRIIPLVPRAALLLRSIIDAHASDDPWCPIFQNKQGNAASGSTMGHVFTEMRKSLGLGTEITPHSMRHAYLTWLMVCGVDPYSIKEIAGHADLNIQQKYIHYMKELLSGGASKIRRDFVTFFCPGVNEEVLGFAFPDTTTFYGSLVSGSKLNILDILFGGLLYDEQLIAQVKQNAINRNLSQN